MNEFQMRVLMLFMRCEYIDPLWWPELTELCKRADSTDADRCVGWHEYFSNTREEFVLIDRAVFIKYVEAHEPEWLEAVLAADMVRVLRTEDHWNKRRQRTA